MRHRKYWHRKGIAALFGFFFLAALRVTPSAAIGEWYDSHCSPCHDQTTTCDGCHHHSGVLSALPDQSEYAPGELVVVTLEGGTYGGWFRGVLYDEEGQELDLIHGAQFPVTFSTTAPEEPGEYLWNAVWFGSNNGIGHLERLAPVAILVGDPASVEEDSPSFLEKTIGKIKVAFRR